MDLRGKIAAVTGGSGGLGQYICQYMRAQGATVWAPSHATLDVTRPDSVGASLAALNANILINCAGVSRSAMSWKTSDENWAATLDTNLTGVFNCIRAVLPGMRERGWGRIINLSSVVGQTGVAGTSAYAASKAGISGLTRAVAAEAARKGVTVNALALGYFDAGMIRDVPAETRKRIVDAIPVGRLGRPEEVCGIIGFLCTDEAAYITGQTINVNGGLYS